MAVIAICERGEGVGRRRSGGHRYLRAGRRRRRWVARQARTLPAAVIGCSLRLSKELAMMEVEPGSETNNLSAAEPQARHDFSVVQGFQVVGVEDHGARGDQIWRDALRLELEARAARFHQAVDAAIVLSNDGVVRWLGDPVARLSVGPDILNPSALIFADASVPAASRDTIKARIDL